MAPKLTEGCRNCLGTLCSLLSVALDQFTHPRGCSWMQDKDALGQGQGQRCSRMQHHGNPNAQQTPALNAQPEIHTFLLFSKQGITASTQSPHIPPLPQPTEPGWVGAGSNPWRGEGGGLQVGDPFAALRGAGEGIPSSARGFQGGKGPQHRDGAGEDRTPRNQPAMPRLWDAGGGDPAGAGCGQYLPPPPPPPAALPSSSRSFTSSSSSRSSPAQPGAAAAVPARSAAPLRLRSVLRFPCGAAPRPPPAHGPALGEGAPGRDPQRLRR